MTQKHPFDLTGRVAVVTGGNGGLGFGMAETLARMGCAVSIWGRNPEKNERALAALKELGAEAAVENCDVTDHRSIEECFARTLDRFGRVDGMFANAGHGGSVRADFTQRPMEEWRRVMEINLDGVTRCFQVAARHMIERAGRGDPFGRLVATSSVAAVEGASMNEHYGASKGAVNAMVRALAVQLARHGITVNSIMPGYAESEMTAELFANEKFQRNVTPRIPMRRFGKPSDYGGVAGYLMSETSGYHTGQGFVIDGGYTIF